MAKLHKMRDGHYAFHCPGCECAHAVAVNGSRMDNGAGWQWNGSLNSPTLAPSIRCQTETFSELGKRQYDDWLNSGDVPPPKFDSQHFVCHIFVREGMIQFLTDCTHKLAGKTVPIPDWNES